MTAQIAPDAFSRFGIAHLSPSSINLAISNFPMFVTEKIFGHKVPVGPAAIRGRAAEAGIVRGLMDPTVSVDDCVAEALKTFDTEIAFARQTDDVAEERADLAAYVAAGIAELRPYGRPTPPESSHHGINQHKIELQLPGIPVPVIGYLDLVYDKIGYILDIKTTARRPSRISPAHGRQATIYQLAKRNYSTRFCYLLPGAPKATKTNPDPRSSYVYELTADELAYHYNTVLDAATRLGRFLSLFDDRDALAASVPAVDYEQFHWSSSEARAAGRAVFGL
jgi:hypothetical protein